MTATNKRKKILLIFLFLAGMSIFFLLIFYQIGLKYGLEKNRRWSSATERKHQVNDFSANLRKKGYSESDIELIRLNFQDWGWELTDEDLPDLNAEERIGVIKQLAFCPQKINLPKEQRGLCSDLVVILRKQPKKNFFGPVINFDRRISSEIRDYERNIIDFSFRHEPDYSQWEIAILCLVGNQGITGTSAGAATYLALLSVLHQKPLSRNLAAMGEFKGGKIYPVGSLQAKITAAFRQGVNCLVLPQKHLVLPAKSQNRDELFWIFFNEGAENYQREVPDHIKQKIETHFVEDSQDLEGFFFQTAEYKDKQEKQKQEIEKLKKAQEQKNHSFLEEEQPKSKERIYTCDKCGRKFNFDREGGKFYSSTICKPNGEKESKQCFRCPDCM